jgi:hypothetical protein
VRFSFSINSASQEEENNETANATKINLIFFHIFCIKILIVNLQKFLVLDTDISVTRKPASHPFFEKVNKFSPEQNTAERVLSKFFLGTSYPIVANLAYKSLINQISI